MRGLSDSSIWPSENAFYIFMSFRSIHHISFVGIGCFLTFSHLVNCNTKLVQFFLVYVVLMIAFFKSSFVVPELRQKWYIKAWSSLSMSKIPLRKGMWKTRKLEVSLSEWNFVTVRMSSSSKGCVLCFGRKTVKFLSQL